VSLKHKLPVTPRLRWDHADLLPAGHPIAPDSAIIIGESTRAFSAHRVGGRGFAYAMLLGLVIYRTITGRELLKVIRIRWNSPASSCSSWPFHDLRLAPGKHKNSQMVAEELMKVSRDPLILLFLINGSSSSLDASCRSWWR